MSDNYQRRAAGAEEEFMFLKFYTSGGIDLFLQ